MADATRPTSMLEGATLMYLIAAVVGVVALVLVFTKVLGGEAKKKTLVVFTGLPMAGKTTLWWKAFRGQEVKSQASMLPHKGSFPIGAAGVAKECVDFPGHLKLRSEGTALLREAFAIVYAVDSVDWEAHLSSNAEYLCDLLTDSEIVLKGQRPHLAIACTKRDIGHSYKAATIKKQLESEIEKVRRTRAQGLSDLGTDGEEKLQLGVMDEKFRFDEHSPLPVTFLDVYSVGAADGVAPLQEWLAGTV